MINNIGIQLNSLRNECEADLDGTFSKLSELGFKGVEFCDFFGKTSDEILSILAKNNLKLISSHISLEDMLDNFEEIVTFQKAIKANKIIIMHGNIHGAESLSLLIDNLNALQSRLRQHRIDLFYHNHEQEFKKYSNGEIAMVDIIEKTDVLVELDAFWAEQAGADVVGFLNVYPDRIQLLHLKDGDNHIPSPIGDGNANCKEVYDLAIKNDVEWVIVELSGKQQNSLEAIEKSINYIKNNF